MKKFHPLQHMAACLKIWLCVLGFLTTVHLKANDIVIIGLAADDPDQISFVTTVDIPANTVIYFTDNEWTGTGFNTGEGNISYTAPASGIAAGTVVTITNNAGTYTASNGGAVATAGGSLALAATGDQLYAYYGTSATAPTEVLSVLSNLVLTVAEDPAGDPLAPDVVVIQYFPASNNDNIQYNGPRVDVTYAQLIDPANWTGSDVLPFVMNTTGFTFMCATISTLTKSVAEICSGSTVQVCVTANLDNAPNSTVQFSDGTTTLTGTAAAKPPIRRLHVVTAAPINPYVMPAGPIYVGDIVSLPGLSAHPLSTTAVPTGAATVSGATTTTYYTVTVAGTYDIICDFHPTMTGSFTALERPNTSTQVCADYNPTNTSCPATTVDFSASVQNCTGTTLSGQSVSVYPALSLSASGNGTCGTITATPTPTSCTDVTYSVTFTQGGTSTTASGTSFTPSPGQVGSITFTLTGPAGAPTACATATSSTIAFNCPAVAVCPTSVSISGAPATACQGETITMTAAVDQGVLNNDYSIQWEESIGGGAFASVGAGNGGQTLTYTPAVTWASGCGGEVHVYRAIVTPIGACAGSALTSNTNTTNVYPSLDITTTGDGACGTITATPTPTTCGITTYTVTYTTGTGPTSGIGTSFTPTIGTVGTVTFTLNNSGAPSACSSASTTGIAFNCPDPCVGFAAPDPISDIAVCEGGSTTIAPTGGGSGTAGTPVPFTYTWDFEGGITGSGISSDATLSADAPPVIGGAGIVLLTQAAGSGCTAAVSSNGYTGATGVPGTQADALANGDYFEFCVGAPQTGYTLAVTGLVWNHRASSTVTNYAVYAANDLSTSLASGSGVTTSCSSATATFAANSATCYRIYYWGATSSTSTLRIDNMVINAEATPISSVSYNFYTTDPSGGGQTPVASGSSYTPTVAVGSSATYYVTAANGTCESTAVSVMVSVTAAPDAGADNAAAVCNATAEGTTTIDLSTLLGATADAGGTFAPVGSAPALSGTTFDGNGLTPAVYSYTYTVNPTAPCTGSDVATFNITVNDCVGAVCELTIGTITVGSCSFGGGESTAMVTVPLSWANAPLGEDITITVQDAPAQTITSPAVSGNQNLIFTVPADGVTGKTISATFSVTTTCSDSDIYDAPASCDPCVGFAAPDPISAIAVCEGGSTTIAPTGGGNGSGTITPVPFTYTWAFEGGITGSGISSDATLSADAPPVIGGAGIVLLTQAAGSGCTAAVSSNGYTGATGVPGTQADALANGDYFEFCVGAPQTGYTLAVTGLVWNHRASSTVTNYAVYAANDLSTSLASGSGVTTSCSSATATFAANSATCYRIYYWGATSSTSTLRIDNMVINAEATPISSVSYNFYTTDPSGGGQTPVASGFAYTPSVAAGSSATYYVTAANGICESTAVTVMVSVEALPNAGVDASSSVCNTTGEGSTTIDLATLVSGANGSGTFTPIGSAPALSGTTLDGNGLTPAIYSYTYTVNATSPCTGSDEAVFSISVNDCVVDCSNFAAPTVTSPLSVCEGGTLIISPSGGGGGGATPQAVTLAWDFENASDLSGVSDNASFVGNPAAPTAGAGVAALSQAPVLAGGCSAAVVTSGFNSTAGTNGQSDALTSGDYIEFCVGTVQAGYTFNVTGMTWNNRISGTGPANYAVYAANDLVTPLATGSITTAVGINACETEAASFSSTASCFRIYAWGATSTGGTFRIDSMIISGQAIPPGATSYNFYDANPVPGPANLLAANAYSYSPTLAPGASATYYVTAANGTCESTAVAVIASVVAAPEAGLDSTAVVCNDPAEGPPATTVDLTTLLNGADAGGTFAAVGSAPALTGTTFDGAGLAPGVYQYSYTVAPASPCILADVAIFNITINDCIQDVCAGFAPPLVNNVVDCQSSTSISITPTGGGAIPITDLFISEYVEGSGNTKCLEIYNGTAAPIVLDGVYSVKLYSNGNPLGSTPVALVGTIAAGDVFVICNTGAAAAFLTASDQTSASITFNGDDAVALLKNGVEIDIFGNIGCDPGTSWTAGANATLDQTLVRAAYVSTGIATDPANTVCDFPTLGTQWTSLGLNGISNLGLHISTAGTTLIPATSYNVYADNGGTQGALITTIPAGSSYSPTGLPADTTTYWVSAVSDSPACESDVVPVTVFLYGPITATATAGDCTNTIASISQDNPAYTSSYVVNYTTGTGPAFGPGFAFDYSALVPGVAGVVTFTVQYTAAPAGCNVATFDVPFDCTIFPCSLAATATPTACMGATYDLSVEVTPSNQLYSQFTVDVAGTLYGPYDYTASPVVITGLAGNGATSVPVIVTDYAGWVVNEMLYDAPLTGGDANGDGVFVAAEEDFVELVNFTGVSQDISGYTLLKNATLIHTFPAGTIIPNGCGIVVFGGGTPTGSFGGMTVQTSSVGATTFNLSANGTHVIALQNGAITVASATYNATPSDDASATRNPDVTGSFVLHNTVNAQRYSPGTQTDGTSFAGCGAAYSNCATSTTYDAPSCTVVCPSLTGQDVDVTAICSGTTVSYTTGSVTDGSGSVTWVYSTLSGFDAYGITAIPFTGSLPANISCAPVTYYLKARLDGVIGCTAVSSEFTVLVYPQINYTVTAQGGCTVSIQPVCPGFMVHYTDPTTSQVVMGNSYTAATGTSGTLTFEIMQTGAPSGCDMAAVNVAYSCAPVCPTLDDTQSVSSTAICSGGTVSYTAGGVTGGSGTVTWVYGTTAGFDAYGASASAFSGTLPANTGCTAATYYIKARLDGATGCSDVSSEFAITVYPNITITTSPGGCTASVTANCPGFNVAYTDPLTSAVINGNSYTAAAGASGNVIFTVTNTAAPVGFSCRTASASVAYNCAGLVCSTLNGQNVSSTAICSGSPVNYTVGSVINNSYTGGTVTWVYGTTAGFNAYGTGAILFNGTLPANTSCAGVTYYLKARLDNVVACQAVSQEYSIIVYPLVSGTLSGQGSCTVSVTPSCPNYTVSYINPATNATVSGSSYTGVTCTQGTIAFTISNPAAPTGLSCVSTVVSGAYSCIDASCSNCPLPVATTTSVQENGGSSPYDYNTYVITVSGGTLPYNFNWDNSGYVRYSIEYTGAGAVITIITTDAAIYNVTISDQNGCFSIINDDQNSSIGVPTLDITNYAITGESGTLNGGINITVSGGGCNAGQYTYLWSNGATTEDISGLASGWYSVTVTCPITAQTTTGWYWVPKVRRGRTKAEDMIPAATIAAMPNPFSQVSSLQFSVAENSHAQIAIYDMAGREVAELFSDMVEAGKAYSIPFEASHLPAGIYTAQLITDNGAVESIKLVLTK